MSFMPQRKKVYKQQTSINYKMHGMSISRNIKIPLIKLLQVVICSLLCSLSFLCGNKITPNSTGSATK